MKARHSLIHDTFTLEQGAPPGGPLMTYERRILDTVPGERIINSYVPAAAGERFSVSLSTVEFLPDGEGSCCA